MQTKRIALSLVLFFSILLCLTSKSQTPQIADDSIVLKLTIKTHVGKKLETTVSFENTFTHKITQCKTDKEGKGECTLAVDQGYVVKIPGSDESYEYRIPEFSISPLPLTFEFKPRE